MHRICLFIQTLIEIHFRLTSCTDRLETRKRLQTPTVRRFSHFKLLAQTHFVFIGYTGNTWDTTLCPDGQTCAENCALDGADYEGTYGITASGNALTLKFVTGTNVGSRVYLMASETEYEMFKLLNSEFTFDVDVSQLPCGLNGALYFSEMDSDGGMSRFSTNKAGAKYGTGYCDSQCPQDIKFIDGIVSRVLLKFLVISTYILYPG